MLVELSIVPLGCDVQWSDQLAEALKLIDSSGLPYVLTPSGTCIEGDWDEVMTLMRRCHEQVRRASPHVLTSIRIEDEEGGLDQLTRNIASVEEKLGRPLRRLGPEARARPQPPARSPAPEEPGTDRSRFDTCADQLRAYARELQATAEDCVARATKLVSDKDSTGLAGASPGGTGASVVLGRVRGRIEDMMAACDRLEEALGGEPRYEQALEQLGARPEPGASSPAPTD